MKNGSTLPSHIILEPAVSSSSPGATVFRRMVLRLFRSMRKGRLTLELPDGLKLEIGAGDFGAESKLPHGIAAGAHIRVRHERFFRRCVLAGDIGFGESFVDGDWETPGLTAVIAWFLLNIDQAPTLSGSARRRAHGWLLNLMRFSNRAGHLLRPNSRTTARRNIREHYDLSNDFFVQLLDPSMMYSSAVWKGADDTLAAAQERKNESLCRMLQLGPADHALEIGTGWGGWSIHAARRYGCRVTTLTISERQFQLARERVELAGVADRVDVQLTDYRDWHGTYDKIVSIEMMEALGHRYLPAFCETISRSLAPQGLVALQFITCPDARYTQFRHGVDFIQKHIFPGSLLLSLNRVNEQLTRAGGFVLNHVEDHGADYAKTLREWHHNLHGRRAAIESLGFDERFFRLWTYYLNYCEAAFAMRNISVVQTLHTRPNNLAISAAAN